MIDQVKGTPSTVPLGLGQPSACPGPPQYQKNQLHCDLYSYQQQQQQQQACCSNHMQQQSHPRPQFYHPYNQVQPQQPRLTPPQQASATQQPQQPLPMPPQHQQSHYHQQLPSQSLPQQFPQQQPSLSQHQQPHHHHLHQQNHHQHQHTSLHQHHLQQQQQQQQQQSTSHNTPSHHPHHQASISHTPAHEAQTQAAPSPAALTQHPHPTAQDVAALEEEKARLEAHLREMRDRRRCVVCLDKNQGAVFMPCSHLVTCPPCAVTLTSCPVCRTPVHYLVPVILD